MKRNKAGRIKLLLIGLLLLAVFPAAWFIQPYLSDSHTICVFKKTTGLDCLFCGLTRSFSAFVHGDFAAAFKYHPIFPLVAIIIIMIAVILILDAILETNYTSCLEKLLKLPLWIIVILLVTLTLIRQLVG